MFDHGIKTRESNDQTLELVVQIARTVHVQVVKFTMKRFESLTSRHFNGEGMRTCFSLIQSRYNMPIGFLSGTFSTSVRSVVYFSNDVEKNGTSTEEVDTK